MARNQIVMPGNAIFHLGIVEARPTAAPTGDYLDGMSE